MTKGKSTTKKRVMYTCKTCGNVSTMKKRICLPIKLSDVKIK